MGLMFSLQGQLHKNIARAFLGLILLFSLSEIRFALGEKDRTLGEQLAETLTFVKQGRLKEADALISSLLSRHPRDGAIYEVLGRVRDAEKRYEEAEIAYKKAIEIEPQSLAPYVSLGVSYLRRGEPKRAAHQFHVALRKDPHNLIAITDLGSVDLDLKNYAEAAKCYQLAKGLAPGDPTILLGLATAYFGEDKQVAAIRIASILSGLPRADPPLHFSVGLLLAQHGVYQQASTEFEKVAAAGVNSPELFLNLGLAYSKQKRYDEAKTNYFKAIELDPSNPVPYLRVGADYLAENRGPLALVWLMRAVKMSPTQPEALYLLGTALIKEKYFETAQTYLEKYVELKPEDPKGWLTLGDAYLNFEEFEKALASYQKALVLVPQLPGAHYLVGLAEFILQRVPEAKTQMLETIALDPSYGEAHLRLGEIAYRENNYNEAIRQLHAVLTNHPFDSEANDDLAEVYLRLGRYAEAVRLLADMELRYPDDVKVHNLLAQLYFKRGDFRNAEREESLLGAIKHTKEFERQFIRHSSIYVE
jgi:tetratricopeptide (TPR) repeat protein